MRPLRGWRPVSILIKQTGLYVLVALVMALLYGGGKERADELVAGPGRLRGGGAWPRLDSRS